MSYFSLRTKLIFSLLVTLLLLGGLEVALRLFQLRLDDQTTFGRFEGQVDFLFRRGIFEPDPELFWKLRPVRDLETPAAPDGLRVNRFGLRGPEWPDSPAASTQRVLTLGDSCTFGWAVPEKDAYPAVLQSILQQHGRPAEVLNGGVPGYTSHQSIRFLERDLLKLQPQLITFLFGWNETWPAHGQPDISQATGGWLVRLDSLLKRSALFLLLRRLYVKTNGGLRGSESDDVLRRVSPEQFEQNLEQLVQLGARKSLQLALIVQPAWAAGHPRCWSPQAHEILGHMQQITRDVAARHHLPLLDGEAVLRDGDQAQWFIDCVHPSVAGHHKLAEALAEVLAPVLQTTGQP